MSSLIVQVVGIDKISEHPNAERLELAEIKGWQVVVGKGQHQAGDRVVYFPPDTVLTQEVSDRFSVTQYLHNGRIKAVRLRGEPSFGLVVAPDDPEWEMGQDVAEYYGATRYQPPVRGDAGTPGARKRHHIGPDPMFPIYTDIENMRHFPEMMDDLEVVATEKIHGANARVGMVDFIVRIGSHKVERTLQDGEQEVFGYEVKMWQDVADIPSVREFLKVVGTSHEQVVVYGEVYGKVQALTYGIPDRIDFRAFDIMVNGAYLGYDAFRSVARLFGIPTVPELYRGPFDLEKIKELSKGKSLIGGDHIREGVVVRPVIETTNPKIGRLVLKYVSDEYLIGAFSEDQQAEQEEQEVAA